MTRIREEEDLLICLLSEAVREIISVTDLIRARQEAESDSMAWLHVEASSSRRHHLT